MGLCPSSPPGKARVAAGWQHPRLNPPGDNPLENAEPVIAKTLWLRDATGGGQPTRGELSEPPSTVTYL